ncbi:ABC transporter transmembrane domain-containing protein [Sphingomonas sp. TDK1]|jgi:putative ABC transport system ATP-binding protein|uniref:ABC transporter transmembrane domain-containing protein n=1 Tax=Sphingomonas sp. TDK1 TaxID=453247 RepID=UPI0007D92923|nr:ABC transporter ATP-binding protein [Sphingomonas sp. TDK1]OAN64889.1 ABC transporter ATP-binding protein [Sphingomonas sp. TDK1]
MAARERVGFRDAARWLTDIIGPDRAYLRLAVVYGVAISLLSLATPISVQLLINSVAHTAQPTALWTLSGVLFLLLLLVAVLSALRVHVMALFERRVFARVVAEVTVRAVHAQNPFFGDAKRQDLFNRFFDLTVVQKAVPSLFIGGFTIVLQSVVGLVITSFYHPFFLAFNAVLLLVLLLVWLIWSRGSFTSAVALSHAKHATAHWLESVGGSNGFYKSSRHLDFAMDRSEAMTATYIDRHRRYFRYSFAQTLSCLFLYAFASAALLALGGTLILRGELSIGQLVAAELILSGVFYGVAQLGWYLDAFYDLVASSEELSLLFTIPQEQPSTAGGLTPRDGAVRLRDVRVGDARFDFELRSGEQVVAIGEPGVDRAVALVLKRHTVPERGLVTIGGSDLGGLDMYLLRSAVIVLDRPSIVEVTIREYLSLAAPGTGSEAMLDVLESVDLADRVARLPLGLDTPLASSGSPLSIGEVMELKLANAMLSRPRVLMLSQLFDLMAPGKLSRTLSALRQAGTTVILFTGRPGGIELDRWLLMDHMRQQSFPTLHALEQARAASEVDHAV